MELRESDVFVFNPFAEGYLAQGRAFTPVAAQTALAEDLENLPQFLGGPHDVVLVRRRPSAEFLSGIKAAGFPLPEFVELEQGKIPANHSLRLRKLNRLIPWAWGPDSCALLAPLCGQGQEEHQSAALPQDRGTALLYSKSWSAEFLRKFLREIPEEPWLCSAALAGTVARSTAEALEAIRHIRDQGHHRIVMKQALGLAGGNAIRLWEPTITRAQLAWIDKSTEGGREIVVEPWLEREFDFSLQLESREGELAITGYTALVNDQRGQYQGNWAAPNFTRHLPSALAEKFSSAPDILRRIEELYVVLTRRLSLELRKLAYEGPLGIDAFVFRTATGVVQLKPLVEINPRYTMGRLLVELMRQVCPGSWAGFRLVPKRQILKARFSGFHEYEAHLRERSPLHLEGQPSLRIREGALCLNDASRARQVIAVLHVGRQIPEEFCNTIRPPNPH